MDALLKSEYSEVLLAVFWSRDTSSWHLTLAPNPQSLHLRAKREYKGKQHFVGDNPQHAGSTVAWS